MVFQLTLIIYLYNRLIIRVDISAEHIRLYRVTVSGKDFFEMKDFSKRIFFLHFMTHRMSKLKEQSQFTLVDSTHQYGLYLANVDTNILKYRRGRSRIFGGLVNEDKKPC